MRKYLSISLALGTCLSMGALAYAAITFNPASGEGFVGKGDVQLALGLNNAQMQAQAESLKFTYETKDTYEVVNAWATGNPDRPVSLNYHTQTVTTTVDVNSTVAYESRQVKGQKQVTGFNLTGFNNGVVYGEIPVVSPTVTYVTYSWDTQVWTGEWTQVPCPTNNNPSRMCSEKIYTTVTHETDQLPAYYDENGDLQLYSQGNNKAVLSVTLLDSVGTLYVKGVALQ